MDWTRVIAGFALVLVKFWKFNFTLEILQNTNNIGSLSEFIYNRILIDIKRQ